MAIGTILAIGSLLGSLVGGAASAAANRQAQAEQDKAYAQRQAWYDRRLNEDPTQRADAAAYLTRLRLLQEQRQQALMGQAAVMGSTDAAVAAQKNADMQQQADVISNLMSDQAARRDNIEAQRMQDSQAYAEQRAGRDEQRAAGIAAAASGLMRAAAGIAGQGDLGSAWTRGAKQTPATTPVGPGGAKAYLDAASHNIMQR